ncbi:34103_t:CDS:2, partial [Racocetra persica]
MTTALSNAVTNSGRHHPHTLSAMDFQSASSGVAAKAMRSELSRLANAIPDVKARR